MKQSLLEECNLHTIVRLPNGVFAPYTGIKTNLLFFTKGKPTEWVWYYDHPYPEGVKSYNKTKPMRFEEFETEIQWWGKEHRIVAKVDELMALCDALKARLSEAQTTQIHLADAIVGRAVAAPEAAIA